MNANVEPVLKVVACEVFLQKANGGRRKVRYSSNGHSGWSVQQRLSCRAAAERFVCVRQLRRQTSSGWSPDYSASG